MVWIREVWRVRKIEDLLDLLLKSKLKILWHQLFNSNNLD